MTKIALGAGIGGLMLAVAVASALHAPPAPPPAPRAIAPKASDATPDRCRTITMPDGGCDAAWDARRRHFFGGDRMR